MDDLQTSSKYTKGRLCDNIIEYSYIRSADDNSTLAFDVKLEIVQQDKQSNTIQPQFILFAASSRQIDPVEFMKTQMYYWEQGINMSKELLEIDHNRFFVERSNLRVNIKVSNIVEIGQRIYFYLVDIGLIHSNKIVNDVSLIQQYFRIKSNSDCLNNCSYNGICSDVSQSCSCSDGQFDIDCSIKGENIVTIDSKRDYNIMPNSFKYFYIDINQIKELTNKKLTLTFFSKQQTNLVTLQLAQSENQLSTQMSTLVQPLNILNNYNFTFQLDLSQYNNTDSILYQFATLSQINSISIQLSSPAISQQETMIILYLCIGSGCFILVLLFGIAIRLIFNKNKKINVDQQQQAAQVLPIIEVNQVLHNSIHNVFSQFLSKKRISNFTQQDINAYMPSIAYTQHIKDQFKNAEQCSVCLEEFFIEKDKIRITVCDHVFHEKCLDDWLQLNENCPLCRQQHSLDIMKRHSIQQVSKKCIQFLSQSTSINPLPEIPIENNRITDIQIKKNSEIIEFVPSHRPSNCINNTDLIANQLAQLAHSILQESQPKQNEDQNDTQNQNNLITSPRELLRSRRISTMESIPQYLSSQEMLNQNQQIMNRQFPFQSNCLRKNSFSSRRRFSNAAGRQEILSIII